MAVPELDKRGAREALGIPEEASVVIWLGRLSVFTKLDPWPGYAILERVARRLDNPLVLLECGPDDQPSQEPSLSVLRKSCSHVRFHRMGGSEPVSEELKRQALSAADLALSLVDNTQETFGLSVAEAMAAGLPVVASNWNGYRDLVRHGIDGYLVPSRWASIATEVSTHLGWQQFSGIESFPVVAGALAQLVQLDANAAEKALFSLLSSPLLRHQMGLSASIRANELFAEDVVMNQYEELFAELERLRRSAPTGASKRRPIPTSMDPVKAFEAYPSHPCQSNASMDSDSLTFDRLPKTLCEARAPLWSLLKESIPAHLRDDLNRELLRKHSYLA